MRRWAWRAPQLHVCQHVLVSYVGTRSGIDIDEAGTDTVRLGHIRSMHACVNLSSLLSETRHSACDNDDDLCVASVHVGWYTCV